MDCYEMSYCFFDEGDEEDFNAKSLFLEDEEEEE